MSKELDDQIEAAFGAAPTLRARGVLLNKVGADNYAHFRDEWRASDGNLKPGKNPNQDDGESKHHANNPFSKSGWDVAKQISLMQKIGTRATQEIAASVGSRIGAREPVQ